MSAAVDEVMEKLKAMTLLEASELVKAIEETFDVDASAGGGGGMMMAMPGGAAGGADAAAPAEEKTEFDLVLESFPADKKIAVLKVVRGITGLGLKEAKEMVEAAPKCVKEGAGKEEADGAKKDLEEAGATVSLGQITSLSSRPSRSRKTSIERRTVSAPPSSRIGTRRVSSPLALRARRCSTSRTTRESPSVTQWP